MSWDHWVVSRKKTRISFATRLRVPARAPARSRSSTRERTRPSLRSAPSWARVNPAANQWAWSQAPRTTKAAAVLHRKRKGNGSKAPFS